MESEFITTEIGQVQVSHGEGYVVVRFHPDKPDVARVKVSEMEMTVTETARPVKHSEVTHNGSTFEVLDVRPNGDGYDVLNGNTGTWEAWVEA